MDVTKGSNNRKPSDSCQSKAEYSIVSFMKRFTGICVVSINSHAVSSAMTASS